MREVRTDKVGGWMENRHQGKHTSGFSHRKGSGAGVFVTCAVPLPSGSVLKGQYQGEWD